MISKRLSIYGFISAAAVVSSALVGCGGSSASVQGLSPIISTTGGVSSAGGTSPTGAAALGTPQQVQVTSNGSTVTGTLPAGESIPPGGTVAVISNSTPIINGLSPAKIKGDKKAPTTGTEGQVWVDGTNTGLVVQSDGSLSGILILTVGNHVIHAEGPFSLTGGSVFAPQTLTVGQFNFGVIVLPDGVPSVPSALTFKLPANMGTLQGGNFAYAGYNSEFAGYTGTLVITYPGVTVAKSKVLTLDAQGNESATYNALSGHPSIPSTGVSNVTFNIAL